MPFHIVLYQPQIPPNTGNIIRLCANSGATLHLIKPLGFVLDDKRMQRAEMDYGEWAKVQIHRNYSSFIEKLQPQRVFAISTKGKKIYSTVNFQNNDVLLFGPESRGLPQELLATFSEEHVLRIPMHTESRSLNLANAVSIILYEAWRQNDFNL